MPTAEQVAYWRTLDRKGKTISIVVCPDASHAFYQNKRLAYIKGTYEHSIHEAHQWALRNGFRFAKRAKCRTSSFDLGIMHYGHPYEIPGYVMRNYHLDPEDGPTHAELHGPD